jgi:hypothetical protein
MSSSFFGSNVSTQMQTLGLLCEDPFLNSGGDFAFNYFGSSSRCFNIETDEFLAPACYKAQCA